MGFVYIVTKHHKVAVAAPHFAPKSHPPTHSTSLHYNCWLRPKSLCDSSSFSPRSHANQTQLQQYGTDYVDFLAININTPALSYKYISLLLNSSAGIFCKLFQNCCSGGNAEEKRVPRHFTLFAYTWLLAGWHVWSGSFQQQQQHEEHVMWVPPPPNSN